MGYEEIHILIPTFDTTCILGSNLMMMFRDSPDMGSLKYEHEYRQNMWAKFSPKRRLCAVDWTPKFLSVLDQ